MPNHRRPGYLGSEYLHQQRSEKKEQIIISFRQMIFDFSGCYSPRFNDSDNDALRRLARGKWINREFQSSVFDLFASDPGNISRLSRYCLALRDAESLSSKDLKGKILIPKMIYMSGYMNFGQNYMVLLLLKPNYRLETRNQGVNMQPYDLEELNHYGLKVHRLFLKRLKVVM